MNKSLWLGPVSVLAFVVLLTVMYGWTGSAVPPEGEAPETPELNLANQLNPPLATDNVLAGQGGQLAQHGQFPAGVGQAPQNQIQLIAKPTFPVGIGSGPNGQMQLINNPNFPAGIGNGPNSQIQLINNPNFPVGIGNGPNSQIQLINNPNFPVGIGNGPNGQMQLINKAQPGAPYLGVNVGEVPEAVARHLKLTPGTGLYVKNVSPDSPAQKAGIKAGDVILKMDHQNLTAHEQIGRILKTKQTGDVVKLVVQRAKRKKSFQVKLAAAPQGVRAVAAVVEKPIWMGADIQDIDAIMKMQFKLPDTRGAIVSHVQPGSPAATAGLATGDVIRRFQGKRIKDVIQLQKLILDSQPGTRVQVAILRGGQLMTLPIVMGQRSAGKQPIPFIGPADMAVEGTWIGMDVTELTGNDAAALGLPNGTRGVLVNDVESPPASMVGFQTGDVIVAVNGQPTPDMKHFVSATQKQNSAVVDLVRGSKHLFISVPPPGFTQQGTKINTTLDNKLKQVAFTQPTARRIAILAGSPSLDGQVAGNNNQTAYVIIVDLNNHAFAVLNPDAHLSLAQNLAAHQAAALIGGSVGPATVSGLRASGITVYAGVVGRVQEVIGLYQSGRLLPAQG